MITSALIFKILHLLGVAFGAGGAFFSDIMFFSSAKNGSISKTEMRFLSLGSRVVWFGLLLLVLSGIGLFVLDPARLMASTKFWTKMTIVGVIIINGIIFHTYHLPNIRKHMGLQFAQSPEFLRRAPLLVLSGAVSGVSWVSALVLGSMRGLPYSYQSILSVYVCILTVAMIGAVVIRKKIIQHE